MRKPFTKTATTLFAVAAALHIARLFFGWDAQIGGVAIPHWPSVIVVILAAAMAWGLWKESR